MKSKAEITVAMARVRLLALDVDGTLTDGGVYYGDGAGGAGEMRRFHIHDGLGVVLARFGGLEIAWITGRVSAPVARRAGELGVTLLRQGVRDKAVTLSQIAGDLGLTVDEVAFMGDDLNDLPALRWAGVALAPANATSPDVCAAAHYVTPRAGGQGAVRDAIETILRARGEYDAAVAAYLASLTEGGKGTGQ